MRPIEPPDHRTRSLRAISVFLTAVLSCCCTSSEPPTPPSTSQSARSRPLSLAVSEVGSASQAPAFPAGGAPCPRPSRLPPVAVPGLDQLEHRPLMVRYGGLSRWGDGPTAVLYEDGLWISEVWSGKEPVRFRVHVGPQTARDLAADTVRLGFGELPRRITKRGFICGPKLGIYVRNGDLWSYVIVDGSTAVGCAEGTFDLSRQGGVVSLGPGEGWDCVPPSLQFACAALTRIPVGSVAAGESDGELPSREYLEKVRDGAIQSAHDITPEEEENSP